MLFEGQFCMILTIVLDSAVLFLGSADFMQTFQTVQIVQNFENLWNHLNCTIFHL